MIEAPRTTAVILFGPTDQAHRDTANELHKIEVPQDKRIKGIVYHYDYEYRTSDQTAPLEDVAIDGVGLFDYSCVQQLEGRILTILDAVFSDQQQRKAMKDLIRQALWDEYKLEKKTLEYSDYHINKPTIEGSSGVKLAK